MSVSQNKPMDLPEDMLDHHLVRVVNAAADRLNDRIFAEAYPGGRDAIYPEMLIKVIICACACACIQSICPPGKIAKSVRVISCSSGSQGASGFRSPAIC